MRANFSWLLPAKLSNLLNITYIISFISVFSAYFAAAYLGLSIAPVNKFATLVWAPTGIALSVLLLFGTRYWAAIFTGAFVINFMTGQSTGVAAGIALGNTLEALIASLLLKRLGFDLQLSKISDVFKLITIAALFSTLISATVGTGTLLYAGVITKVGLLATWSVWWLGDALGDLVVAPFILTTWTMFPKMIRTVDKIELGIWTAVIISLPWFIFNQTIAPIRYSPRTYLIFPVLIWGAVRLRQPFVSFGILLTAAVGIWQTVHGIGPFANPITAQGLFFLQFFIAAVSITGLILTAAVTEARTAQERVEELNKSLRSQLAEIERLNSIMIQYIKENRIKRLNKRFKDAEEPV